MTPPDKRKASFAYVYDALYGGQTAFLRAQLDFLQGVFGPPRGPLLDVGCGTGIHVDGLNGLGYAVIGADLDPRMLRAARCKLPDARLVLADMRRLPFHRAFAGMVCLESPLAYLLNDDDLRKALQSIGNALVPGGKLVIDVFDYPGTLGTRPIHAVAAQFESGGVRVSVRESHRLDEQQRIWIMRQEFQVEEQDATFSFPAVHRLAIRTMDGYAKALEREGFTVLEALTAYPNTPTESGHERRVILVARR